MRWLFLLSAAAALAHAADPAFDRAERKLDLIQSGKATRGSVIVFPLAEINAWARHRVPEIVPEGIRDQRVELALGTGKGLATVNFLKMRQAKGQETNWLVSKLIEGERPIEISVRVESAGGRCTVYLTEVILSGVSATGTVLDFLIKNFFLTLYPDAKINQPFDLDYNIDRIELRPSGIRVSIKR